MVLIYATEVVTVLYATNSYTFGLDIEQLLPTWLLDWDILYNILCLFAGVN